jgi:Glycosyltransferase
MFSVVIPIYNHAKYLLRAVNSCLASRLVTEILLVDDGSRDDSAAIAARLAAAHRDRIRNLSEPTPRNLGAHHRLNQLCREARAPWIAVLNSDDYFVPYRFDLVQQIARLEKADLVSGALLIIDEDDQVIGTKRGIFEPEYAVPLPTGFDGPLKSAQLRYLLCSQNFIATTSNMVFRRTLFDAIGGFADLRYVHDWDFALRACMMGRCVWTPNFLTAYRVHRNNTIREQSPHMDGEISRMFYDFLADYPEIDRSPEYPPALLSNQHIAPYIPPAPARVGAEGVRSIHETYHLPPTLSSRALCNALLGLYWFSYDFVVLSSDLQELPIVHCTSMTEALVHRREITALRTYPPSDPIRGRFMRVPVPSSTCSSQIDLSAEEAWSGVRAESDDLVFHNCPSSSQKHLPALRALEDLLVRKDNRPTCLVLPIFMAVGGAERNTIEIIRELQPRFRFVVVTTERLAKHQGSLHYQLDEMEVLTFDLAEVANREHHMDLLTVIAQTLSPDLVWICNGSPWLLAHSLAIRRLFTGIPIVDQQVYDTEVGWIEHYHDKGIQSFDHFIAINARIRDVFLKRLKIPVHRVTLIYHAVNERKLLSSRVDPSQIAVHRLRLGLKDHRSRTFVFVGRLTKQKRPLVFLDLARLAQSTGTGDRFVLVGNGELGDKCATYIEKHNLTNVTRIPYTDEVGTLLAVADGLIVTSQYEGLPIVMLEALSVGTPVLATDVGDIKLVLDQYQSGTTFPVSEDLTISRNAFAEWAGGLARYKERAMSQRDIVLSRFASRSIGAAYGDCFDRARLNRQRGGLALPIA